MYEIIDNPVPIIYNQPYQCELSDPAICTVGVFAG